MNVVVSSTFTPPMKREKGKVPLGKVSMIDQNENLTFLGCLGSTLRKKVFLIKETL